MACVAKCAIPFFCACVIPLSFPPFIAISPPFPRHLSPFIAISPPFLRHSERSEEPPTLPPNPCCRLYGKNGGRFLRYARSCLARSGRNDGGDAHCAHQKNFFSSSIPSAPVIYVNSRKFAKKNPPLFCVLKKFFYTFEVLYFIEACYLFYLSLCLRSLNQRGIANFFAFTRVAEYSFSIEKEYPAIIHCSLFIVHY
jgi:hypothetical protein